MESRELISVETKIRAAVAEAKAKGWRIATGSYYVRSKRQLCVLAACCLAEAEDADLHATFPDKAAAFLGITRHEAIGIVVGFDNDPTMQSLGGEFVDLGKRLHDLVDL